MADRGGADGGGAGAGTRTKQYSIRTPMGTGPGTARRRHSPAAASGARGRTGVMETSLLKTLAGKHRSTVSAMARKHRAAVVTPAGPRKMLQVVVPRNRGRKLLVAWLRRDPAQTSTYSRPHRPAAGHGQHPAQRADPPAPRRALRDLRATADLEVHHIRKLAGQQTPAAGTNARGCTPWP